MTEFMYRYRNAEATLSRFNELENSTIFFPELKDLNDPLEGFRDIYWQGDKIVWESLLQHYTYVLMLRCIEHFIGIPADETHDLEILAQNIPNNIANINLSELYKAVSNSFLDEPVIQRLVELLSSEQHKLRRDALIQLMGLFQPILLAHITTKFHNSAFNREVFEKSGDMDTKTYLQIADLAREKLTNYIDRHKVINAPSGVFAITTNMLEQLQLIKEATMPKDDINGIWQRLIMQLPTKYIKSLEAAMYPKWFTACFSTDPINSSMWGMYADCHKGVCLKFRTTSHPSGIFGLKLNTVNSWSSGPNGECVEGRSFVLHQFQQVNYSEPYPPLNFFSSLGSLPIPLLAHFWFCGRDGKRSDVGKAILGSDDPANKNSWRNEYWANFAKSATCKTSDWSHEKEYRIVLSSSMDSNIPARNRLLEYKFEDLHGIIFGINTSENDKIAIIDLVHRKCKELGRSDFEFEQVRYDSADHKFRLFPLSLLSFPRPSLPPGTSLPTEPATTPL